MTRETLVLGIESSCDDTAAALVRGVPGEPKGEILAADVFSQDDLHAAFGGVVPEIAARAHAERLDISTAKVLAAASVELGDVDAIAVTSGPGLIGGVLSGVMFAKGLAAATGKPIMGINHLAGHALTPRLIAAQEFPYLMLLVSGGHCQFILVEAADRFHRLGGTIDDAPGEAFDKIARLLGLGYPGGPEIERQAKGGDPARFHLPRPLLDRPGCDMSFSGLKTAARRQRDWLIEAQGGLYRQDVKDLSAGFQAAVADVLAEKTCRACKEFQARTGLETGMIAVAGGVAANQTIRAALQSVCDEIGFEFSAPPLPLCTDNAAMIAWAGIERMAIDGFDDMTLSARPRWPLDAAAQPLLGSGKKGAKA